VIDLVEGKMDNVVCKVGTHPFPTTVNVAATKELVGLLDGCAEEDLIIAVISGGGSSLLCYPVDMTCEEERNITKTLMKSGANISEINTVRKHISRVKSGQLAKICYPATVISLVFSDVPGDDLSLVASGPLVKDTTTMHEAMEIMHKYNVLDRCKLPSCSMVETPKEDKYFEKVTNVLICSSKDALMAMAEKAEDLGLKPRIWQTAFQGEARKLGPQIVQETKANECLLGAGESTVTVTGKGRGGRNQEMALAALEHLSANQVFVTVASDGYDNSEAAGALVDQGVLQQAKRLNLSIAEYLENNDSYIFFQETGSSLQTGLTGANVSDFFVSLRD
jgi:glycerate-2-kinase